MLQQQAKRQGSPWRSPGAKAPSPRAAPRVAPPAGFEAQLLEPEDLAWESPSSVRHSSSAHPSSPGDISSDHQPAPKAGADPSPEPHSGKGSQGGSPDKPQGGSGRQSKGLSSYPLVFSRKVDPVKRLTDNEWTRSSRSKDSAKVRHPSVSLLAAFYLLNVPERHQRQLFQFLYCQSVNQSIDELLQPVENHWAF